uniref:Histone deacetylase complex subunit SAP30 Sin3 binding domain-containing protein n=1 Tax=Triticum urartu TaxID=4572 RepID=A0A8R7VDP3_TRIUA
EQYDYGDRCLFFADAVAVPLREPRRGAHRASRHTKVVITGNNRTKSVLVGLQGVVKKAVGLGGWHWLVLKNGVEVKLQRNALSVLEAPTGNEDDDEIDGGNGSFCGSFDMGDKRHELLKHRVPEANKAEGPAHKAMVFLHGDVQQPGQQPSLDLEAASESEPDKAGNTHTMEILEALASYISYPVL